MCYIKTVLRRMHRNKREILVVENLKEIQFFIKNLYFPIVIYITNDWEKTQVSYLKINRKEHNTESICKWCIQHGILYQIYYSINKTNILKSPYKFFKFIQLKRRLAQF